MSNLIPGNHKHLTLNDRMYIEEGLDQGRSFRQIAKYLCKDPSTISKKYGVIGSLIRGTVAVSIIRITFAYTDFIARRPMHTTSFLSVIRNADPAIGATMYAAVLSVNTAAG